MKTSLLTKTIAALSLAAVATFGNAAEVVFESTAKIDAGSPFSGYCSACSGSAISQYVYDAFSLSDDTQLTGFTAALYFGPGTVPEFQNLGVRVYEQASGYALGAVLRYATIAVADLSLTATPYKLFTESDTWLVSGSLPFQTLVAGDYFLGFYNPDQDHDNVIVSIFSEPGRPGLLVQYGDTRVVPDATLAFRLEGNVAAVPEPATASMMSVALLCMSACTWRRRRAGLRG